MTTDLEQLLNGKTPVSVLQEYCSKRKLTATYDVLANEGPVHEPVFVMRAQAGDFQGTGKGSSKKKAKHNAASQLLCAMHDIKCELEDEDTSFSVSNVPTESRNNYAITDTKLNASVIDGDMQGNPIGELQEYTQKNLLRPPQYQFIGEQGPPHAREFVCTVKLAKLQETAVGKSKKIAKRAAASKLLQSVRQLQNDNTGTAMLDEEEDELSLPLELQQIGIETKNIKTLTAEDAKRAREFYDRLKFSSKAPGSCRSLQGLNSENINSVKLLTEFAKEKKFVVNYFEIKEKSYSGQCQCLVQIATSPIAVCYGSGMSPEDAKSSAAQNALQYLKVMTTET